LAHDVNKPVAIGRSSSIVFSRYNAQKRQLILGYEGGGVYRYMGIPPKVVRDLQAADSKGAFVNQVIKTFRYERIR
jgi:hypothetical protein